MIGYLIRHGESEANRLNVFSNTGYQHGLTEKGKAQAHEVLEQLKRMAIHPKAIYTSPLQRAVETTEIIAEGLGVTVETANELIEFSVGSNEGQSSEQAWQQFKALWDEWFLNDNDSYRIEGGESLTDIVIRFEALLERIRKSYSETDKVLFIGHGGTFKALWPFLDSSIARKALRDKWLDYTQFIKIIVNEAGCILKNRGAR